MPAVLRLLFDVYDFYWHPPFASGAVGHNGRGPDECRGRLVVTTELLIFCFFGCLLEAGLNLLLPQPPIVTCIEWEYFHDNTELLEDSEVWKHTSTFTSERDVEDLI